MKIRDYRAFFIAQLAPLYDITEAESFFYRVLEDKNRLKRIDLALQPELVFTAGEISEWDSILEKLKQQVPIQYILGKAYFYGLDLEVDKNVLIPRPETEELVGWILSNHQAVKSVNPLKILDIGTGSGCIAIALAKNLPHAQVFAIDISEGALATAEKNAASNSAAVTFMRQNILETGHLSRQFDIVVSNPPYVRNLEKAGIMQNVLDNEPHLALFVEDHDPLRFYRKIAALAIENLPQNGELYFEINQYLGNEMMEMLEYAGFRETELRKDIYGNDRMVKALA